MDLIQAFQLYLNPARPDVVSIVGGGGKSSTLYRLAAEIVANGQRVVMTTTTRMGVYQTHDKPFLVEVPEDVLPFDQLTSTLEMYGCALLACPAEGDKQPGITPEMVDELARQAKALDIAAILVEADGSQTLPAKAPADHEPVIPSSTTLLVPVLGVEAVGSLINLEHMHRPHLIHSLLGLVANGETSCGETSRLTPAQAAQLLIHQNGGAKALPKGARLLPLINKADTPPRLATARLISQLLAKREQPSLIGTVGLEKRDPIVERWATQAVVILAAGASRRMGRAKQLEVVDGEPMVLRAVKVARQCGADEITVVLGSYADEVTALLEPVIAEAGGQIQTVYNDQWRTGQASSVRAGVSALPHYVGCALFMPVDQPYLSATLLHGLLSTWRTGARLVAPSAQGQLRGAPALFDRTLWPVLSNLQGDVGARSLLKQYEGELVSIPVAAEQLRDIDSPEDL